MDPFQCIQGGSASKARTSSIPPRPSKNFGSRCVETSECVRFNPPECFGPRGYVDPRVPRALKCLVPDMGEKYGLLKDS